MKVEADKNLIVLNNKKIESAFDPSVIAVAYYCR